MSLLCPHRAWFSTSSRRTLKRPGPRRTCSVLRTWCLQMPRGKRWRWQCALARCGWPRESGRGSTKGRGLLLEAELLVPGPGFSLRGRGIWFDCMTFGLGLLPVLGVGLGSGAGFSVRRVASQSWAWFLSGRSMLLEGGNSSFGCGSMSGLGVCGKWAGFSCMELLGDV